MRPGWRRRLAGRALPWLVLLLLVPGQVLAQKRVPSAGGPADRPVGVRFVLPNGVVVLVAERPGLPIVTVAAALGAGAVLDPPDAPGLANLTALLLGRGSRTRTGPEIDRAIEFVGGSLDAEGGRDTSQVVLSILKKDLTLGLDLLADALVRPTFPEAEFERKREEVQASVRRSEEDPGAVAGRLWRRLAFPGHPYGLPVTGTEASLSRITRDDVGRFHAETYRPEATVIAVAGDVTVDQVRAELTARLGQWAPASGQRPRPGPPPPDAPAGRELVRRDLTQATVLLGRATVTRGHPDHYPLVLANYVLGGGSASRLYTRVREERGLAYSIGSEYAPGRSAGVFLVEFQSRTAQVRETLGLVREEIERLRRERVSAAELARVKAYLIGSFPFRMDTNADLATLLLRIEEFDLGLDYPTRYRRAIEAVTAADVLRAVRTHWDPAALSLVVVGNVGDAGLGEP